MVDAIAKRGVHRHGERREHDTEQIIDAHVEHDGNEAKEAHDHRSGDERRERVSHRRRHASGHLDNDVLLGAEVHDAHGHKANNHSGEQAVGTKAGHVESAVCGELRHHERSHRGKHAREHVGLVLDCGIVGDARCREEAHHARCAVVNRIKERGSRGKHVRNCFHREAREQDAHRAHDKESDVDAHGVTNDGQNTVRADFRSDWHELLLDDLGESFHDSCPF